MITNAHVVQDGYDPDLYHKETVPRGHNAFVMGRSSLVNFASCPSRWLDGFQREDSDATDWGTLIDCLVLTPELFAAKFAVKPAKYPDAKTGELKDWNGNATFCKEWAADHEGKKLVKADDYAEAQIAVAKLQKDDAIAEYLACSAKQVYCTATWEDPATGLSVPLKTLIDLAPDAKHAKFGKTLGDFKTARDAGLRGWPKVTHSFGYNVQAALELDIYNQTTGDARNDFRHVIQENVAPYQTGRRIVSLDFINLGREAYRMALAWYCECLKSAEWPDYDAHAAGINGWSFVAPEPWMLK